MYDSNGKLDLSEIIASQADTTITAYQSVVVAIREPDEREAIVKLFDELKMDIYSTSTGEETVYLVQDHSPSLLVMDIQLEDAHGWQVLGILKESVNLDELPIIVIVDDPIPGAQKEYYVFGTPRKFGTIAPYHMENIAGNN